MNNNYFHYGVPISFGWTAQYLDRKTETRRVWKDSHAAKFVRAFDQAATAGQQLCVPALDKGYHAGGGRIGWCLITQRPYKEQLVSMPQEALLAEGGMAATKEEFISKYFKGNADLEVWVIEFKFVSKVQCPSLEPLISSLELEASVSDANLWESLNLLEQSKFPQAQEPSIVTTSPIPLSGMMYEPLAQHQENLTALSVAAPAKTYRDVERRKGSTAITLPFGGKCSESSMNPAPPLLDGKTLRERCTEELETLLPASEWLVTKLKAQSLYRQRNSVPHTCESEFSLLPTATTYPSGSGKVSPAGRNKLENTLRSLVTIPTPKANDGSQGYNNGRSGGRNLTGYLLATPQNANSPTLLANLKKCNRLATPTMRDFKGTSPTKKEGTGATLSDNVSSFIQPAESANPQIWGWMMGFPKNWCESVLMPLGFAMLSDQGGGIENPRPSKLVFMENAFKEDEIPLITTELPASPPKLSPSPSELGFCKNSLKVLMSRKSDEHNTPAFLAIAARSVMGGIDLDPMSNAIANETIRAHRFFTKSDDGLTKPWRGRVWLNPPFSLADQAVPKLIESYESGDIFEAVLLLKSAVETKRYQSLYPYPFVELNKRVKFDAPGNKNGSPFATVLFYLGTNFARWREVMSVYGRVHPGARLFEELERDRSELLVQIASMEAAVRR